ncbi:hypothetical protein FJT64_025705 [Amphibalanus amphitrite]|uniref:Uncharacterized protein n=1 Tax=Amphibalanus amphitrite TaxID=1232801 RepID=A0A6A4W821_AMPAM|nr:hypothetical protein FJT64_025705 [Amphibalanus amphitrite]
MCDELKTFIASENTKCVREVKEANDRRMQAVEDSLSFALDSVTALSNRQKSADSELMELKRETADLKMRLQQLELNEDRQEQQKRLSSLIFSGPVLQAESRRERAANLIESLIRQYIRHALDRTQVKTLIRFRNGKVMMEFTSSGPGSDRDIVYRSRARLRGSGLFVSESLTPRRQAMFMDLLSLKKEGRIFSVFTRSGDILACKSRDSAPVRVADPEAVRRLAVSGAPRRPAQGRAQEAGRGALLGSRSARDAPERGAVGGVPRADRGENKETEAACPTDTADAVRRDPPPEPREQQRQRAVDTSELADRSDHQRSRVAVQSVAGRCSLGDGGRPALLVAGTAAARLVAALAVASGGAASPVAESVSVLSAAGSVSAAVAAWLGSVAGSATAIPGQCMGHMHLYPFKFNHRKRQIRKKKRNRRA